MTTFTPESLLLIQHWRTFEDILSAVGALQQELSDFIHSLECDLEEREWWNSGWVLDRYAKDLRQVYISNQAWRRDGVYGVWIGVERVTPGALFGAGAERGNLYVWVTQQRAELRSALVTRLGASEPQTPGDIDTRMSSYYVARKDVVQYIGGDINEYVAELKQQTLDFFAFYAQWLWGIDDEIQQHMGSTS